MLIQLSIASRMKLLRPSAAELQYKVQKLVSYASLVDQIEPVCKCFLLFSTDVQVFTSVLTALKHFCHFLYLNPRGNLTPAKVP